MDKEFYKPEPSAPYEPQLDPSFNPIPFEINSNEIQYYRPQPKAPQQHQPPTPPPAKPQAQQTYIDVLLVSFNFEMKDGEQTKTREYMFSLAVDQDNLMIFGGTYSQLESKFGKNRQGSFLCGSPFPYGPSLLSRESSTTSSAKIGGDLANYFTALLNKGGDGSHLRDPLLLEALKEGTSSNTHITSLFSDIATEKQTIAITNKQFHLQRQQYYLQLRDQAVSFLHNTTSLSSDALPSLTYSTTKKFVFEKPSGIAVGYSRFDYKIFGEGDTHWFQAKFLPMNGITTKRSFVIYTREGAPLVKIVKKGIIRCWIYKFDNRINDYQLACVEKVGNFELYPKVYSEPLLSKTVFGKGASAGVGNSVVNCWGYYQKDDSSRMLGNIEREGYTRGVSVEIYSGVDVMIMLGLALFRMVRIDGE